MKKQEISTRAEAGFTLIELIMVIVILGILAAVAVPKFTNLSTEALAAALTNVAGGMESASTSNLAACAVGNAACETIDDCSDIASLMQGDALPTGYTVTAGAIATDATVACTVTQTDGGATTTANITGT